MLRTLRPLRTPRLLLSQCYSTAPQPKFTQPGPIPLGNRADQKEFEDLVKQAQQPVDSPEQSLHPDVLEKLQPDGEWEGDKNPLTGEIGGPKGKEPTRYGDWERKGRVYDF
ncbi:hypothetical protein PhCBS80983_g03022 [Powellomyces hirtus]|uniref:Succinate dehydrogenase assembly factor 4, mitochondrial n=1 Tax=Powellomyces hirtus TaxID=109895 RepID=A0A507E5G9_9FUNG|nr:hypothetical protein PhCBS80983_g03022 [Powellomyces hirtus]